MAENTSLLKNGSKVLIENQPYLILETDFVNPGKGQAFTRIKIRNLLNNKILEKTIKIGESLAEANVINKSMQFLYKEQSKLIFMDLQSYEQNSVEIDSVEIDIEWLQEGDECEVILWNENIIQIELPKYINQVVISTEDTIKGDTVSSTLKDAKLENGIVVKVPMFIKQGESIKVDTRTGEYSSRAKE
tara:strand:+ start:94 stop:660 length:567 start_codon:yes stop_codon:yes gene_type:complete